MLILMVMLGVMTSAILMYVIYFACAYGDCYCDSIGFQRDIRYHIWILIVPISSVPLATSGNEKLLAVVGWERGREEIG